MEEVQRVLGERDDGAPWLTVEDAATLLGTTPGAIRTRLSNGWMKDARIRDGRRVLLNRRALLDDLEKRRR